MKIPTRVNKENKLITYKYSKRFVKTTRRGASKSDVKYAVRVGNPHQLRELNYFTWVCYLHRLWRIITSWVIVIVITMYSCLLTSKQISHSD